MENERPVYVLMVRAERGVDSVRALRAWLKIGLRTFGLRCVEVQESKHQGSVEMDARKYASKYVRPDNVRDAVVRTRILNVFEDERYGNLMLELETGSQFRLNDGNTNVLIKAWGHDTNGWIGEEKEIELFLGTYTDWKEDPPVEKETVRVRAIPPAETAQNGSTPAARPLPPSRTAAPGGPASLRGEMDDEIPFALEWR
jgi:hypothetical protein